METDIREIALDDSAEQLVVMEISGERYGVSIGAVSTIIRMQEVTSIPRTPNFVEGVINLRGSIIPVIDLRKRFGLPVGEITKASRIVVVEAADQMIGMMVDAVCETLKLPQDAIEPPSPIVVNVDSAYVRGVGKQDGRLVILLDVEKVLSAKENDLLSKIKVEDSKKAA
ncbi:MAG: chemotaxis protein CheW [Armatimonadetes bacterium]|nr:chemotaxis protein CheW [Armatimonadota bacterium]